MLWNMLNDLAEAIRRWTEKKSIGFFTCLSVWRCASLFVSALCFTPYCQSTVMHKPSPFHFAGTFLGFACLFFLFFRLFLVFGTVTASELPVLMPAFSLLSPWMRRVVFFLPRLNSYSNSFHAIACNCEWIDLPRGDGRKKKLIQFSCALGVPKKLRTRSQSLC